MDFGLNCVQVRFSSEAPDQIVLPNDSEWEDDYRAARVGHWEALARDRARFMNRIQQTEQAISWIFAPHHRSKILDNLLRQSPQSRIINS